VDRNLLFVILCVFPLFLAFCTLCHFVINRLFDKWINGKDQRGGKLFLSLAPQLIKGVSIHCKFST